MRLAPAGFSPRRRQALAALPGLAVALGGAGAAHAQGLPKELRLGVVPYLSTRSMIAVFEPLRRHLAQQLHCPVATYTASDLRAFGQLLRDGAYDIAFAPIHFMRLAEQAWGYRIVAQVRAEARVVIVTERNSPVRRPADLAGRRLVSLDRLAITSMLALDWLDANGLQPGRDLQVEFVATASSTLRVLEDPAVDALVLIESQLADFPPETRQRLRVAMEVARFPPPGHVVAQRLGALAAARIQAALTDFGAQPGGGGSLARSAIRSAALADSAAMARYAQQLQLLLG